MAVMHSIQQSPTVVYLMSFDKTVEPLNGDNSSSLRWIQIGLKIVPHDRVSVIGIIPKNAQQGT